MSRDRNRGRHGPTQACVVFAVACLLVAAAGPAVSATSPDASGGPGTAGDAPPSATDADGRVDGHDAALNMTVTISRAGPERLRVRLTFAGSTADRFAIADPEWLAPVRTDGYIRDPGKAWGWRGGGTPPEFVYTVDEAVAEDVQIEDGWATADIDAITPEVGVEGGIRSTVRADDGYATGEFALLGAYDTAETRGRDAPVTAVVSTAAGDVDADAAARTLANVTRSLDVGGDPEPTTMIVVPAAYEPAAGRADGNTFLIRGNATQDGLMAHEYLHTRQEFDTDDDMEWFVESSAFYYQSLIPYNRGTIGWEEFERRTAPRGAEIVLAENTSYGAAARGIPVLAALDRRLRDATNNSRTLADVHARLNGYETVDYATLRAEVVAVAGSATGEWLDNRVRGSAPVADPEPGQYVPADWRPDLEERVLVCAGGEWTPAVEAAPLRADTPVDVAYTGPGALQLESDYRTLDRRAGTCDRDALGRLPGPAGNDVVTVAATSDLRFVVERYYHDGNRTLAVAVAAPTPTVDASDDGNTDSGPGKTPMSTSGSEGTPTSTPGFGLLPALAGVAVAVIVRLRT